MQNPYLKKRKKIVLEARQSDQTKQSFKDQCNITNIICQYDKTGLTTHINEKTPQNIDHTQIPAYQDTLNFVTHINQQFDQLPQEIKERFKTKEDLSQFISDPKNYSEAQKLGLLPQSQGDGLGQPTEPASPSLDDEAKADSKPKKQDSTNND